MKVKVKGGLKDIMNFGRHIKLRDGIFRNSPDGKRPEGRINHLARTLHPPVQKLRVTQVTDEAPGVKTFRFMPLEGMSLAPFRAGQYVSLSYESEDIILSRPYSLSSPPGTALTENYYEITIKKTSDEAFFSSIAFSQWKEGVLVDSSGPAGTFYYEPLRDGSTLLCLAGGSGITPFRSLVSEELKKNSTLKIHLFYGINTPDQEVFKADFQKLKELYAGRFSYDPIVMTPTGDWQGKKGVISRNLLTETLGEDVLKKATLFICGPRGFHEHLDKELEVLKFERKQIRRENFSPAARNSEEIETYQLTIIERGESKTVAARSDETLITALEKAGMNPPVLCRSGECGWCRSQLIRGEFEADDRLTGLRGADRKFNWIHPCVCFPKSDITIRVPVNPAKTLKKEIL